MFFIRQKTSNGVRIIDWSSDVCSSDLKPAIEPAFFWATRRLASPAPLPPAGEGGAQRRVRARLLILRVRAVRGSRPSALLPRAAFELQALALPDGVARCLEVVGLGQNLGVAQIGRAAGGEKVCHY